MVKVIIISLLVSVACTTGHNSIAQSTKNKAPEKYRAIHWGVDEGLGQMRWHNAILKDVNGFVWFGSNHGELSRFDGSTFKQFFPEKNKPGSIRSNNCHSMVEDSVHNIWIGTAFGLARYDIKADTFSNFSGPINPLTKRSAVIPFWATSHEVICFEVEVPRVVAYNIHTFKSKEVFNLKTFTKIDIGYIQSSTAYFDSTSNSIWMLPVNEEGLLQLSISNNKIVYHKRKTESIKIADAWAHKDAEAMCYDRKRNCLWINSHDGLIQFTLNDQKFHVIQELKPFVSHKEYTRMVGIDVDQAGRIWMATLPEGILIYDPQASTVTIPVRDSTLQYKIGYGNLKIYCDRTGIVWTSYFTLTEIYQLIPFSPSVTGYTARPDQPDSLNSLDIQNMVADGEGKLWIGTNHGLNIYDPQTSAFKVLQEKDIPGIRGEAIVPMVIDTIRKKVWLNAGRPDNLYVMDMLSRKCRPVIFKDTTGKTITPRNIINFISHRYKNGCLFLDAGYGIFEINAADSIAHFVIPIHNQVFGIAVIEDKQELFLGNFPYNLHYQFSNDRWVRKPHMLDSLRWNDIHYDEQKRIYTIAAENSILQYDKEFNLIRKYTDDDGSLNRVLTVLPDGKGNIFFNNYRKGIGRLNLKTGITTMLSDQDGYTGQFYDAFTAKGRIVGGNLFFAGNPLAPDIKFVKIDPKNIDATPPASVYLRSLEIKDFSSQGPGGINDLKEVTLQYFQNRINIEIGVIDFYAKGVNHVRYKLEENGKRVEWQYASAKSAIHYEGLVPGEYKLFIQASNVSSEFNGPVKVLSLNISPAFWNTWWFRAIALIFLVDVIYNLLQWRFRQKFKLRLERSEKEKQVAELQQQKTALEMQALRAQMNPHFIFNSLNSINRFILQNNRQQASEYLTKFSKLVRLILQNSQATLITLESELEALNLYLDLEALRFDHRFGYKISVPKDLDIEVLKVPPLIIQPYTENAIWHGLMHKEDKGQLDIEVSEEDDHLYFKITDNGIGRKKAAEIASKTATKHKSMGLRITKDRIAMLQKSNGAESPVKINDLVNPDGTAAGTEVVIKMPAIYE